MQTSMASSFLKWNLLLCAAMAILFWRAWARNPYDSPTSQELRLSTLRSVCQSAPYPDACFNSLKLSISININPSIITYVLEILRSAISESVKLSELLSNAGHYNIIEKQRGAVEDCKELHQITVTCLERSMSRIQAADFRNLADARAFLSAALTNKNTCLEGLDSASGPLKPTLVNSILATYQHVSNSLSMLPETKRPAPQSQEKRRHLLGVPVPAWVDRRILQTSGSGDEYDPGDVLTVAQDGSGNFTTITDAVTFAPNNSDERIIIYVKQGVYGENVEIPSYKPNLVLLGDGSDVTLITGDRSVADGWTTFRSATIAVSGEGFLARDISFENSAGAEKHQAVALRVNADLAALYRCTINGYQDTLYVHSFRQFYRECDIYGTIDFIFGNAAVVLQACNIVSRMPLPGQFTVITAQSRDTPDEDTGISIQNCSILATDDLSSNSGTVKSYLGRPFRVYSRTVYLQSYLDGFIDPSGWTPWPGDEGLDTLYYGEFDNYGPGSGTADRVTWPGYHVMDYNDASNFTVYELISGDEWLDSTAFPYDEWI